MYNKQRGHDTTVRYFWKLLWICSN